MTVNNDVITINYCVNYGGRTEIAEATREIAREAAAGQIDPDRITEATIAQHLHRPDIPDVDLFIRTSGEQRSSNFMLWQAAYAEYVFQDKLWPDYDRRDLWAACEEYASTATAGSGAPDVVHVLQDGWPMSSVKSCRSRRNPTAR